MPGEFRDRLRERFASAPAPTSSELDQVEAYFQLLVKWNRTINLTALPLEPVTDAALDRLFVGPLLSARLVPTSPHLWFDFGSGGGIPAVPMKILRPQATLTLIESRQRKAAFLREVVRELGLPGTRCRGGSV